MVALELGYVANVAIGLLLLVLSLVVWRFSADRAARGLLAAYLALVGFNYATDALRFLVKLAGLDAEPLAGVAFLAVLLDPPLLLAYALASTRGPLRPSRLALLLAPSVVLVALALSGVPVGRAFVVLMVACYAGAFVLVVQRYLAARDDPDPLGTHVVAFALVCLPRVPLAYVDWGLARMLEGRSAPATLAMDALLVAGFAAFAILATRAARPSLSAHARRTVVAVGSLLLVIELAWLLRFVPVVANPAFGLLYSVRWLLFLAVVSAGLRRHEVFGVPTRAAGPLRATLLAVVAVAGVGMVASLLSALVGAPALPALLAGCAVTGVCILVLVALRGAMAAPREDLAWRRASVLRARALLGATDDELEELRASLGVDADEARQVVALARAERDLRPTQPLEPGVVLAGRYDVERVLGAGAFGRAFAAVDRRDGRRVVLKELRPEWHEDPEAVAGFRREAEIALTVAHPNLVAFRAVEPAPGGHVLVLDHVPGETLAQRLRRGPLNPSEARTLAADLLGALGALHARGIVHRDVKPANVVITPHGRAVLLDMGAATARPDGTRPAGGHPGSPAYMSPEQARGGRVGPASDLYALAVVVWEALTARLPPQGNVPDGWGALLARALSADPKERPASAEAFRHALP